MTPDSKQAQPITAAAPNSARIAAAILSPLPGKTHGGLAPCGQGLRIDPRADV